MVLDLVTILWIVGLGALGGLGYIMLQAYKEGFEYFTKSPKRLLHIGLGAFAAFAAVLLGMPNHFNSLVMGWLAPTILEQIMTGTQRIRNGNKEKREE